MRPDSAEEDLPLIYGLELQARALSAGANGSDSGFVRFVVGTQSLKTENQIHLLEYQEESHSLSKAIFKHPAGEIWNIASSPKNPQLVLTSYAKPSSIRDGLVDNHCSLWKFPIDLSVPIIDEDSVSNLTLEKIADFDFNNTTLNKDLEHIDIGRQALWKPEEGNEIVNYAGNKIYLWDVEYRKLITSFVVDDGARTSANKFTKINAVRWSPHSNCSTLGVAVGSAIYGKDIRVKNDSDSGSLGSSNHAWSIKAHCNLVRDLDFNPNAQYYVASCGDDCESRFWDIRKPEQPAVSLLSHSHWIWSIRYNQFHDQLVLTCSSDSRVVLTRVASLASQPFGHLLDEDGVGVDDDDGVLSTGGGTTTGGSGDYDNGSGGTATKQTTGPTPTVINDEVVATFEEHEESVYAAEWSSADPWIFASLSYDGRLVIDKVPKSEKFNILF